MRRATLVPLLLGLALAGCGSDDEEHAPIPAERAAALLEQLDQVERQSDGGICGGAKAKVRELEDKVARLPDDVDPDVREALDEGLDRLLDLVDVECEQNKSPREEEEPEPPDLEQTEPEQTEPEQTEPEQTEPEQTEPEQTLPEQTEPEQTDPDLDGGSGDELEDSPGNGSSGGKALRRGRKRR